jgi:hypothetical protein
MKRPEAPKNGVQKLTELLHVHIGEKILFSVEPLWLEEPESFFLSLLDHLYSERSKPADQTFVSWLDRIGYPWLRSIRFQKDLPSTPIERASLVRFCSEFRIDLDEFHEKGREDWVKWGGDLREFMTA